MTKQPSKTRALSLALFCPVLSQYAGLKHKHAVKWNELDAFACLCGRRLWVPDSANVSAPSHLFPLQVASKRSALVLLGGIYSCCLLILVSPTRGPILVTFLQLKLFKYNSYSFGSELKIRFCRLKKHNCLLSYGCTNLSLLSKHFKREVAQTYWKAGEDQTFMCHTWISLIYFTKYQEASLRKLWSMFFCLNQLHCFHLIFEWASQVCGLLFTSPLKWRGKLGLGHI